MSKPFKDYKGRYWDVTLDLASAKRVDHSEFDELTSLKDWSILRPNEKLWIEILENRPFMAAVIWAIVQPQVQAQLKIDPNEQPQAAEDEFLSGFNGEAIESAKEALFESLAGFFPRQAIALSVLKSRHQAAIDKVNQEILATNEDMQKAINRKIEKHMEQVRKAIQTDDTSQLTALIDSV